LRCSLEGDVLANAITVTDSAGNVSIHKGKSHSLSKLRIDPLISTIMAIRRQRTIAANSR
jgi:hypothetical protein